jgi:hypothetical protein
MLLLLMFVENLFYDVSRALRTNRVLVSPKSEVSTNWNVEAQVSDASHQGEDIRICSTL